MDDTTIEAPEKKNFLWFYERYMMGMGVIGQLLFYMQGYKIFMTRSATDVSIIGFFFGLVSVSSWLLYGILIRNRVLMIANLFAVVGALFVFIGILLYG